MDTNRSYGLSLLASDRHGVTNGAPHQFLGQLRHPDGAAGDSGHGVECALDGGKQIVGANGEVANHSRVEAPFDLRERDEKMLTGEQILSAPTRFVLGSRYYPQTAVGKLREIEIEIFQVLRAPGTLWCSAVEQVQGHPPPEA